MLFSGKSTKSSSSSSYSFSSSSSSSKQSKQGSHPQHTMSTNVTACGDGLEKGSCNETLTFSINGTPPTEKDGAKFNPTSCSCAFEGPSKPDIRFSSNNLSVSCEWVPKLPGNYKVYVKYEDKDVKGSPFMCKITGGADVAEAETKKVKVSGKGASEGKTKLSNDVIIDTRQSLIIGGLSVSMEGPAKPEISFKKNEKDGTFILTYKPDTAGPYKLYVKFLDNHVPGSPFAINVK